jgi:hypothetical protein
LCFTGSVDASELKGAFEKMGVKVTQQEVNLLIKGYSLTVLLIIMNTVKPVSF